MSSYMSFELFWIDGSSVSGLILKYKEQEEMLEVKLTVVSSPDTERKQALTWLVAMQKVSTYNSH